MGMILKLREIYIERVFSTLFHLPSSSTSIKFIPQFGFSMKLSQRESVYKYFTQLRHHQKKYKSASETPDDAQVERNILSILKTLFISMFGAAPSPSTIIHLILSLRSLIEIVFFLPSGELTFAVLRKVILSYLQ